MYFILNFWSLTLIERILRAFENKVLRRIFRPKKEEVIQGDTAKRGG
jgi:hypothetical protein